MKIKMKKNIYYLPRAILGLIVAFLYFFVLAEGISPQFSLGDAFWHFVTATIVLLITILAWKKPKIGGFIFVSLGIFWSFLALRRGFWTAGLTWPSIPIITGILFFN